MTWVGGWAHARETARVRSILHGPRSCATLEYYPKKYMCKKYYPKIYPAPKILYSRNTTQKSTLQV